MISSVEKRAVIQQWRAWHKLVHGDDPDTLDTWDYEYQFAIDRTSQESTLLTAENGVVTKYAPEITSRKGEKWVQIEIWPKNPYSALIATCIELEEKDYFTEMLVIYLSNQGRALEMTTWTDVSEPLFGPRRPYGVYLKNMLKPESLQLLKQEPRPYEDFTETLKPLERGNLERLDSLLHKVRSGTAIQLFPFPE